MTSAPPPPYSAVDDVPARDPVSLRGGYSVRPEATSTDPSTSYIASRPLLSTTLPRTLHILAREIKPSTTRESLDLVSERNPLLVRDVNGRDWQVFADELFAAISVSRSMDLDQMAFQRQVEPVITKWNDLFFGQRNVRFVAAFTTDRETLPGYSDVQSVASTQLSERHQPIITGYVRGGDFDGAGQVPFSQDFADRVRISDGRSQPVNLRPGLPSHASSPAQTHLEKSHDYDEDDDDEDYDSDDSLDSLSSEDYMGLDASAIQAEYARQRAAHPTDAENDQVLRNLHSRVLSDHARVMNGTPSQATGEKSIAAPTVRSASPPQYIPPHPLMQQPSIQGTRSIPITSATETSARANITQWKSMTPAERKSAAKSAKAAYKALKRDLKARQRELKREFIAQHRNIAAGYKNGFDKGFKHALKADKREAKREYRSSRRQRRADKREARNAAIAGVVGAGVSAAYMLGTTVYNAVAGPSAGPSRQNTEQEQTTGVHPPPLQHAASAPVFHSQSYAPSQSHGSVSRQASPPPPDYNQTDAQARDLGYSDAAAEKERLRLAEEREALHSQETRQDLDEYLSTQPTNQRSATYDTSQQYNQRSGYQIGGGRGLVGGLIGGRGGLVGSLLQAGGQALFGNQQQATGGGSRSPDVGQPQRRS